MWDCCDGAVIDSSLSVPLNWTSGRKMDEWINRSNQEANFNLLCKGEFPHKKSYNLCPFILYLLHTYCSLTTSINYRFHSCPAYLLCFFSTCPKQLNLNPLSLNCGTWAAPLMYSLLFLSIVATPTPNTNPRSFFQPLYFNSTVCNRYNISGLTTIMQTFHSMQIDVNNNKR